MNVKKIKLVNFRNHGQLNLEFEDSLNVIHGNNAQGKTNILEAMFLCACGKSHRSNRDIELVKFGEAGYRIELELKKEYANSSIDVRYNAGESRTIKINEIPIKKMYDLMGNLVVIMFSPDDLAIIKEGPSERRRLIDIAICQLKPNYFHDLQQYNRALSQRNYLLKEIKYNKSLLETLEIWNYSIASLGSRIMKIRKSFINKIEDIVTENYHKIASKDEDLKIKYIPSFDVELSETTRTIENTFLEKLSNGLQKEIIKGSTLYGPQRDEFEVHLNGNSLKTYGSQGQQRSAILAIKLSEIAVIKEDIGENPVVLLDDVMSELDNDKQMCLLNILKKTQTFITCTNKEIISEKLNIVAKYIGI